MRTTIASIGALLLAAGVLFVGSGLQGSLLALRANAEGFALAQIGLLMSAYSGGFVIGCQLAPILVKNVGHIRAFTALASIASAAALAHVLLIDAWFWMALRGVSGLCFAGLMMVIESWINEKASNANRGRVLSIYRIVDLGSLTIGQMLLTVADPETFVLFAVVSILVSLALVPVALSTAPMPAPLASARVRLKRVFRISPLAAVGTLMVGMASSAFWSVGPVFVQDLGHGTGLIATFMSLVILSGALAQWPLGALSDHMDRRLLVNVVALLTSLAGLFLFLFASRSALWMLVGGGLFGAFGMSLFGLYVAQANDHARTTEFVSLNAGLLLLYGLGSIIGPMLSSFSMQWFGTSALFGYTAGVHFLLMLFGFWRMSRRIAAAPKPHADFSVDPQTSPMVFEMDPRVDISDSIDGSNDGAAERHGDG